MFLGILPAWVGDLFSVLGLPAILLAVILFILNSKGANRKLVVEEGGLKKSEFDSITDAQNKAIERAESAAEDAETKASIAVERADVLDGLYEEMREIIHKLRAQVRRVIASTNYQMSPDELADFEMTKPPPRPPMRKIG